jgi:photosystem II stability/assembly factor-like uncharacterized protein
MSFSLVLALTLASIPPQEPVVSRLFAATSDGPFLSYSWGEHWTRLRRDMRGLQGDVTAFLCLGPSVFAGTSEGLFVSDDFGENYRRVPSWPGGAGTVTALLAARLFALEPTLFVGTTSGLYRSKDGGYKWERVGASAIQSAVRSFAWPGPDLFVATDGGLFRSVDGGGSWARVEGGLSSAPLLSIAASQFFGLDPTLFVGTSGQGLYKSEDGGKSFHPVGSAVLGRTTVQALFWWGALLLVGGDSGLFLSDDGGGKFRPVKDLEGLSVLAIAVPGADSGGLSSEVIVGTRSGVLKSSDGAQRFRAVDEGMGRPEVHALATFPSPPQERERRRR